MFGRRSRSYYTGKTMASRPPNVLLVTVDCLRRDRISAYGYGRATTPFLDGLMDGGLHGTSAHSTSSWTCPSVVSILTGQYPHRHGAGLVPGDPKNLSRENLPTVLDPGVPLLADLIPGASSAAFLGVWNAGLSIPGRFQHQEVAQRPAGRIAAKAIRWMRSSEGPFVCWIHLKEPHDPLEVPRSSREFFGPIGSYRATRRWKFTKREDDLRTGAFRSYRERRINLYDAAVRSADDAIGRIWEGLGASVRDRTILAVTADHGEELWEHRDDELEGFSDPRGVFGVGHGHNLFQVHVLVPLVLAGAGIPRRTIEANVSLVDVVPTLLAAAEVKIPAGLDGLSLLDPIPENRPVLAEAIAYGHDKRTVVLGDEKLLVSAGDNYALAFGLGPDRREAGVHSEPSVMERLGHHLPEVSGEGGPQVAATPEILKHLHSLGYLD